MMGKLVSIVVPIYNTAEYLQFCLDSIVNQTYKNIEVILVDDGSTDDSLEICQEYEKSDRRIHIVRQYHKGLVTARKTGVKNCQGEYCIFVDSDDWIQKNLVERTITLAVENKADIVNYNLRSIVGTKTFDWRYTIPDGVYEGKQLEDIYAKMMFDFKENQPGIVQSLCSKLVRKKLLWASMEKVDERISLGEDAAVVYQMMLLAKRIVVTGNSYYCYMVRTNSMMQSVDTDIFKQIFLFQQYMKKVCVKYNAKYKLNSQLQAYIIHFVEKGLKDVFLFNIRTLYYIPSRIIQNMGKRVVLYGAGNVGQSYYRQLLQDSDIEIPAWVDREYDRDVYGRKIESPSVISNMNFDSLVIAVANENTAEEIKKILSERVPKEKILWERPLKNFWGREWII